MIGKFFLHKRATLMTQLLFDPDPSATVFVGHFFVWLCVLGGFYTSGKAISMSSLY